MCVPRTSMHMDPEDAFQTGPRMLLPMQLLSLALLLGIGLATLLLSKLVESWVPAVRLWLRRGSASRLPPGTMGWPLLGETLHFFSQEPGFFFQGKQKRYGDVFKTHVLGCPAIMVASPEAIKFVMAQDHLFKTTFPSTKERLLGRHALFFHSGEYHLAIRRLALAAFRPDAIRHSMPHVQALALKCLATMDSHCHGGDCNIQSSTSVIALKHLKDFTFDVATMLVLGPHVREQHMKELKQTYYELEAGYNSFPLNLPGTRFHKAMRARRRLQDILGCIMDDHENRLREFDEVYTTPDLPGSFLQCLMDCSTDAAHIDHHGNTNLTKSIHNPEAHHNVGLGANKLNSKVKFSRDQIVDNVLGMLFAGHGTTAAVMTWLLKYLGEHPNVLQAITAEQERLISTNKGDGDSPGPLPWLHTKNAPCTTMVIQETLRASSILSFTYREAVQDVEYKGYTFPRGWKVLPLFRNIHYNSALFANPQNFDPGRFESVPKANTFMPFGQGVHSCVGSEVAKMEMHILIHHLTTKYRWEIISTAGGVTYSPFPVPKDGLPIHLFAKSALSESAATRSDCFPGE